MPTEAPMQTIGVWNSQRWCWADYHFDSPGPYFWDGQQNVHAGKHIAQLTAEVTRLQADLTEAVDTLSDLRDWQNGPPLLSPKWQSGWGNAMERTGKVLEKHRAILDEIMAKLNAEAEAAKESE